MKRKVSLCMAVLMLFSVFGMSASAGWDGYVETSEKKAVFSTGNILDVLDSNMVPVSEGHPEGSPNSAVWKHNVPNPAITILPLGTPRDFSGYTGFWTWMYSAKKTNASIGFICHKASGGYNMASVTINWEGWKKVELDFMANFGSNVGWDEITRIDIYAHGWDMTPNPETELYINDIYLTGGSTSTSSDNVDPKEVEKVLKNSICFHTGNASYLNKGKPVNYSGGTKSIEKTGVCYVPIEDLAEALKADLSFDNGKVLSGTNELKVEPLINGETVYLPVDFTARALGKSVTVFKYLVVVSDEETIEAIRRNDRMLEEIGRSVTKDHTDYTLITRSDCDAVLENWEKYLTGGTEADDSDPDVQNIKKRMVNNARDKQATMNNSGNPVLLWGNQPCSSTATMRVQYTNMYHMALGWATPGTETYHDEQLKKDILFGLEWCWENLYGEDEIKNEGWRDTWAFNWYEWQIGVPMDLSRILILLRGEIPEATVLKYLKPLDYFTSEHFGRGTHLLDTKDQGANVAHTVYGYMASQLMQGKAENAARALALVVRDFAYQDAYKGDGPQRDGSYRFHYYYPMNGTYSVAFMESAYPLISVTNGTWLQVSDHNMTLYADWVLKAHTYSIYNNRMMNIFKGRAPGGEANTGRSALNWMLELSDSMSESDRIKLQSYYRYFYDNGYLDKSGLSIHQLNVLNRLMKDENVKAAETPKGFNVFYNTDKAVWQNGDYALGISMCSSRTSGWESINGENKKGWYLSDGMVYTYNKEDVNSYENAYWSNVNWYHLPGTTVDTQERVAESIQDQRIWKPSQDFVGGAALNQTYGTAAMIMESCHNETYSDYKSDYGNALPVHYNDLMANKSYFVFDDEMVCLGSGINSTMNFDVQTILDNRMSRNVINLNPDLETIEKYEVKSVEVSDTPEAENIGPNVIDGNFSTRWSAENEQTLKLDLGEVKEVGMVGIAVMHGKTRTTKYDIYLSADGTEWVNIFKGESSGKTEDLEIYDGKKTQARYVRFDFHGNSQGSWNSITEVAVYPARKDGIVGIPRAMHLPEEKLTIDGAEVAHSPLTEDETQVVTTTATDTRDNVKWLHLENSGGFVFLEPAKVSSLKTLGSIAFTEMWIEHGKNPVNDTYAYVMLPSRTPEATKAYSEAPDVTVISNTPSLQAVKESTTGVTGMVFYNAGTCEGVTTDTPCIITMQKTGDAFELSVSDPTMREAVVTLTFADLSGYKFDSEGSDVRVSFENGIVKVNTNGALGEALKVRFVK